MALPLLIAAALAEDPLERLKQEALHHPELLGGHLMRGRRGPWKRAIDSLPTAHLEALIRLLTRAEGSIDGWEGGRMSTAIWLFQLYVGREGATEVELAEWILQHGSNRYAPYGTDNYGARTLEELRSRRHEAREALERPSPRTTPAAGEELPASAASTHSPFASGLLRALGGLLSSG